MQKVLSKKHQKNEVKTNEPKGGEEKGDQEKGERDEEMVNGDQETREGWKEKEKVKKENEIKNNGLTE